MKKFSKVCLIIAALLSVFGISCCIAGAVCGIDYESARKFWKDHTNVRTEIKVMQEVEKEVAEFQESYQGIENLELELGVIEVEITVSQDEMFHVYGRNLDSGFHCEKDGNTLELTNGEEDRAWPDHSDAHLVLEIPEGTVFQDAELSIGMGKLEARGFLVKNLDINCGMGSVTFQGQIEEECDISNGMGEITMELENREKDFNYSIECGAGNVKIGGESYSGHIDSKRVQNNNTNRNMDIECGMGSVTINFK